MRLMKESVDSKNSINRPRGVYLWFQDQQELDKHLAVKVF